MKYVNFHILLVIFCLIFGGCKSWRAQSVTPVYYEMDSLAADSNILQLIAPYKATVDSGMGEILAELPFDLVKDKPNGSLGLWMADACRRQASLQSGEDIEVAVLNQGGIRRPYLQKGQVNLGMIYELMPFDNNLIVISVKGFVLYDILEVACSKGGDPVSGVSIHVKADTLEVMVGDSPLDMAKEYTVATNDYMYMGGDGYGLMQNTNSLAFYGLVRDALVSEMKDPYKWPFPQGSIRIVYSND